MGVSTEGGDEGIPSGVGARRRLRFRGYEAEVADVLCGGGMILSAVYSLAFVPAVPSLLASHPVLLEALTGTPPAIVAAAAFARVGDTSLVLAVLAALPGSMLFDPFFWWAGHRWGSGAAHYLAAGRPRSVRAIHRTERWTHRYGWLAVVLSYYLPVPTYLIFAAAGWSGMRLRVFLILDAIGTLLWIALLAGLGWALGHRAVHVAKLISHYSLIAGIALFVVVVAWQVWRARRV